MNSFLKLPFLLFVTFLSRSECRLVDMTLPLMGQTIYIESLYYPGWWVGASDRYIGALFQLSEASVFDPAQPCRVEVVDCWVGWACLRTRYREFGLKDDGPVNKNITMKDDARSYFLEAAYFLDAAWVLDTASAQHKPGALKWKIMCTGEDLELADTVCHITSREYQGAELYPTLTGLNTRYREEGDKDEWFRFRIMNPKFTQISEEGEVVSETCNHSSESDLEVEFSYTQGITVTSAVGMTFSASMSEEVKGGCIAASASGSISTGWQAEISSSSTWSESTTVTLRTVVRPGKRISILRLTGHYGTMAISPYEIGASNYNVYEENC